MIDKKDREIKSRAKDNERLVEALRALLDENNSIKRDRQNDKDKVGQLEEQLRLVRRQISKATKAFDKKNPTKGMAALRKARRAMKSRVA